MGKNIIQNPTNLILGIILALVFAADICTTQICLSNGLGYEANPIMRAIVDNPLLIILVKGIALCLVIAFVKCYKTKWIGYIGMSMVIVINLGVVINNLLVIL